MEKSKKLKRKPVPTIFDTHGDKITEAYDRAVREALIWHRKRQFCRDRARRQDS